MSSRRRTVRVRVPGRPYEVIFERGGLDRLGRRAREAGVRGRVAVVSDATVAALYAERVLDSFRRARLEAALIAIPPGERHKTLRATASLYREFAALGLDRESTVVALGGGVVGDLAGFAAATWLRGVAVIQAPTTVLAQADASVGGKTGVDLPEGKNLVGAFHQPRLVLSDPDTLATLPVRHRRAGLAEVAKVAMALDARLFRFLEREAEALAAGERETLAEALAAAVRVKARVVAGDERDRGRRQLLNYGHTVGHALEAAGAYRRWLHGEAVALGMGVAGRLSRRRGRLTEAALERQDALLERLGLPRRLRRVSAAKVLSHLEFDKKRSAGRLAFVLTEGVGVASVQRTLSREDVVEALIGLGAEP